MLDPAGRSQRAAVKEMKDFLRRFILFPERWKAYPNRSPTLKWERVKFDAGVRARLPNKMGVYSFILEPELASHAAIGYLLYIGKAEKQTLQVRCCQYLGELTRPKGRILVQEMLELWPDNLWLHFAVVEDQSRISEIENDLLEAFIPPCNDEFPATIRRQAKAAYRC